MAKIGSNRKSAKNKVNRNRNKTDCRTNRKGHDCEQERESRIEQSTNNLEHCYKCDSLALRKLQLFAKYFCLKDGNGARYLRHGFQLGNERKRDKAREEEREKERKRGGGRVKKTFCLRFL